MGHTVVTVHVGRLVYQQKSLWWFGSTHQMRLWPLQKWPTLFLRRARANW